jgi:hydrogenase maturation protease
MTQPNARCLILACGNPLRSDDGIGLWLAAWAERRFIHQAGIKIIARQQWTPELAEDVSHAQSVLFIDCSVDAASGSIQLSPVEPAAAGQGIATHHSGAAELLALSRDLFHSLPKNAQLLTIGAGSTALGEGFSEAVTAALPEACRRIEEAVLYLIAL